MSRSKFAGCFRDATGMPPAQCPAERRMTLARRLLRERLPVEQVAHRVGYQSQPAFFRPCLTRVGTPPSAWQRARLG